MKTLSLTQPWASLVALGKKKFETRSWSTGWRGELLIHAAKTFPRWAKDTCHEHPFCDALEDDYDSPDLLPTGVILCRAELLACVPTAKLHMFKAAGIEPPNVKEIPFGDYSPGRFAWALNVVEVFAEPIPAKGALGLWEFDLVQLRHGVPVIRLKCPRCEVCYDADKQCPYCKATDGVLP